MGKVHVHIHKRTGDAKPYWRVLIDGKLYCTEESDADAKKMVAKLKADPQYKGKTITSVEASTTAGAGIQGTAPRRLFNDAKPATDAERRERIQRVMRGADVTEATARNMLEGEDWNVMGAIRELTQMRTLGFVIDSVRDGMVLYAKATDKEVAESKVRELDEDVRAAFKKLTAAFQASGGERNRAWRVANSDFINANYEYHKVLGKWHPLAREMD